MRYILLTPRGLEGIACREPKEVCPPAAILEQGRGAVLVELTESPRALLDLHSIDDLYIELLAIEDLDPRRNPLVLLHKSLRRGENLDEALALRWSEGAGAARGHPRAPSFRVMSTMEGRQPFRRIDAQHAVETALALRYPTWRLLDAGSPDLQFAVWIAGRACRVGLRLVGASFARRAWKIGHIPASLPPSIAYGLVRTAGIVAQEVVLDPFCGAGTILVERGLASPAAATLLGSDLSATAREEAAANAARAHVPVSLHSWDATALPLDAAAIDSIVTNPPYGRRYSRESDLPALYAGFLAEAARVLRPGGRCVVLTSERLLMEHLLAQRPELRQQKRFSVDVLGIPAYLHLLRREGPP